MQIQHNGTEITIELDGNKYFATCTHDDNGYDACAPTEGEALLKMINTLNATDIVSKIEAELNTVAMPDSVSDRVFGLLSQMVQIARGAT